MLEDHRSDAELAGVLAAAAGRHLMAVRREVGFTDPKALRAAGDRGSHELLMKLLGEHAPGDAVLSEEGLDDLARLSADRVWIVDPLDGTREFAEEGRVDWAVHVALWVRGSLTEGAVALPAREQILTTDRPYLLPERPAGRPIRIAVSRSRAPQLVHDVAAALGAELVPMGSAGYKTAAVVLGDVDAYLHAGGQYEWDSAAPVVVAAASGLHTSRIDGSSLVYNAANPLLPDLLVCRQELADDMLSAVKAAVAAA